MKQLLERLNQSEIPTCIFFNRINQQRSISHFFAVISRLGNGVFWYTLMVVLPLIHGFAAFNVVLHMLLVAMLALIIYKVLKTGTKRPRPYHFNNTIVQNVPALDQFSFPSGHTMHAVSFTTVLLAYYPQWSTLLIPFTVLVALSRLVLGLHYPSDVIIGVLIGYSIGATSLLLI